MKKILTFMSAACCLYTAKLFVSPVYPLFCVLVLFGLASVLVRNRRLSIPLESKIILLFLVYATFSELYYLAGISTYINLLTGVGAFVLIRGIKKYDSSFWRTRVILAAKVFAVLGSLDTLYRLSHPQAPSVEALDTLSTREEGRFYLYKFGSLMFADSNTTAIVSVIFLFSLLGLSIPARKNRVLIGIYLALVVLSLSRAAMLATGIMLIFFTVRHRFLMLITLVITGALFSILFLNKVESDGSFLTKFDIGHRILGYYLSSPIAITKLIFGVGYDNSIEAIGVYTHILAATLLFEGGLISLVIYSCFIFVIFRRSRSVRGPLAAVLILSMSYFLYVGGPFFYVVIAFLINYDLSKAKEDAAERSQGITLATVLAA